MALSDTNPTPPSGPPTGDLEQLFRQKFAEAEVQPRAALWEQIDHNLVVGQNETYRRRLGLYRWVAAASVLLLLGFGSWFGLRYGALAPPQLAYDTRPAPAAGPAPDAAPNGTAASGAATRSAGAAPSAAGATGLATASGSAAAYGALPGSARPAGSAAPAAGASAPNFRSAPAGLTALRGVAPASAATAAGFSLPTSSAGGGYAASGAAGWRNPGNGYGSSAAPAGIGSSPAEMEARMTALAGGTAYGRPGVLNPLALAAVPVAAADLGPEDKPETAARPRRWKLLGTYAAAAFAPNINFAKASPNVGTVNAYSPVQARAAQDTYAQAAAEYRQNLRAGLGQRVALTASYAAGKHWTLLTGVEAAEHNATSQTSYGFLDSQHMNPDASRANVDPNVLPVQPLIAHRTTYRYRTVGLPVQARYTSGKPGVSVYAKVGAVVSVLLNAREELEGSPEATKVYTLSSVYSPYRQLQVAARGGAGARYQPANATWSVSVGPTADAGLTTLNAGPGQSLLRRARPYAVGMEASVEFGGKPALAP